MDFEKEIKLVHWNIAKRSLDNLFDAKKQDADILVFSEFPKGKKSVINEKITPEYQLCILGETNMNGIAIYRSTKLKVRDSFEWKSDSVHPDCVCVEIVCDNSETIKIAGTRFQNCNLTPEEKRNQILSFMLFVKSSKPDIIIGDFNWVSAIHGKRKYLERMIDECRCKEKNDLYSSIQESINELKIEIKKRESQILYLDDPELTFCSIMDKVRGDDGSHYVMDPTENENKWSKQAIKGHVLTNPDRVVYNAKRMELCESDYFPKIDLLNGFPKEWMSDHAMHKVTIKF